MAKQYVSDIIGDEYKEWKKGDIILIKSPTGTGKSEFIKSRLIKWCKTNKKSMLLLSNRDMLKQQQKHDTYSDIRNGFFHNIQLSLYQSPKEEITNYDYVVCDECHYFFEDSSFNRETDIIYKKVKDYPEGIVILLSATPDIIEGRLKGKISFIYDLVSDVNNYSLYKYTEKESVREIIRMIREEHPDEKIMFFSSTEEAHNLSIMFNDSAFICSKYNKNYSKFIDEAERKRIESQNHFNCNLLCTTTALDNGINIKDKQVKHIILDVFTPTSTVQCFGRKRLEENEQISIYLRDYKSNNIRARKNKLFSEYEIYKDYRYLTHEEFAQKHHKFPSQRILDLCYDSNQGFYFEVNECIKDWDEYIIGFYSSCLIDSDYYFRRICEHLRIDERKAINIDKEIKQSNLELVLNKWMGEKIFKEEQVKFIEEIKSISGIGLKSLGRKTINGLIEQNKLPYIIISTPEGGRQSGKRGKHYWSIVIDESGSKNIEQLY